MLASDLNNPEFVNPTNPDSQLHVEFFWHSPQGPAPEVNSIHTGLLEKIPYVRIMAPGMDKSVIETPVRDEHKHRWPQKWLSWQMAEGLIGGGNTDIPGWKLADWDGINENQRRELEFLRFATVEQIAGANDTQIQRLGMGGIGLRNKAREAIKMRNEVEIRKATQEQERVIEELKARDAQRDAEMAQMRAMMEQLAANQKKKPGRPRKDAQVPS